MVEVIVWVNLVAHLHLDFGRRMNFACCITIAMDSFHPSNSFLMLVGYHLYGTNLQNKTLGCFENQQNWFMSSFVPSSKSSIVNTTFQNNYNQILEITPSCSAYHSEFVSNFCSKNLLIWDFKLNFQRKPCKIHFKIFLCPTSFKRKLALVVMW